MGEGENEDSPHHDVLRPEHVKALMIVKIKAFGNMIRETQQKTLELYQVRKDSKMDVEAANKKDGQPEESKNEDKED